jgi:hypothetical protein
VSTSLSTDLLLEKEQLNEAAKRAAESSPQGEVSEANGTLGYVLNIFEPALAGERFCRPLKRAQLFSDELIHGLTPVATLCRHLRWLVEIITQRSQKLESDFACFDDCYNLFPTRGRKGLQKILNRLATFEIVDEILKRNARSYEHRRAAHDFRIGVNHPSSSSTLIRF